MTREALAARIHRFLDDPTGPDTFASLALDIHRWQVAQDPVLAALVERPVATWTDVPAVPVALFRDLPVGTVTPGEERVVFRTSGTTVGARGVHRLRSTDLYDHGAILWAERSVPGAPRDVVALLSDPAIAPDSSLSHMVALFGTCTWHSADGVLDRASLDRRLASARGPVYVATTAFAAAEWLEGEVAPLPPGSVVMVTGGFKGRRTRLDDLSLYARITEQLRPGRVVTEYGMTELSSQLWGTPGQPYRPPHWLRAAAVDPVSGALLASGQVGQLRFWDLCNLDGTLGVETLDEGIVHGDGTVTLIGRLADAPPRGCSLTVEEAWARRTGPDRS